MTGEVVLRALDDLQARLMLPAIIGRHILLPDVPPMGLLVIAACNRSINLASGFCALLRNRNYTCAAPLIRMQLDNAMRIFAGTLVANENEFAMKVFNKVAVGGIPDVSGKPMKDGYLIAKLEPRFPQLSKLYGQVSGDVHLSDSHCRNILKQSKADPSHARIFMGAGDKGIGDEVYLRAIRNFRSAMNLFMHVAGEWVSKRYGGISVTITDAFAADEKGPTRCA
jgi:hypothetical protein